MVSRRDFLKIGAAAAGAGMMAPWHVSAQQAGFSLGFKNAQAVPLGIGLSDPAMQPKFVEVAPNALDPGFMYTPDASGEYTVGVGPTTQNTGLVDPVTKAPLSTDLFGYGQPGAYT